MYFFFIKLLIVHTVGDHFRESNSLKRVRLWSLNPSKTKATPKGSSDGLLPNQDWCAEGYERYTTNHDEVLQASNEGGR